MRTNKEPALTPAVISRMKRTFLDRLHRGELHIDEAVRVALLSKLSLDAFYYFVSKINSSTHTGDAPAATRSAGKTL